MACLYAIWNRSTLHLWARRAKKTATEKSNSSPFIDRNELRKLLGDHCDTLLIQDARDNSIDLLLPCLDHCIIFRTEQPAELKTSTLVKHTIPTLTFSPADAIDLLTSLPSVARHEIEPTDALQYWSRAASLVLEILAKQRFIPDVYSTPDGTYRGYWRAVVNDDAFSARLAALIATMPPVCRAFADDKGNPQAFRIIENFLYTTVDRLVRRSLEGDELAHRLQERSQASITPQTRWLAALVREDPRIEGPPEELRIITQNVHEWLAKLTPGPKLRTCRMCLRLHPPEQDQLETDELSAPWLLTLHVKALSNEDLVLDADQLFNEDSTDPLILARPFYGAKDQLREDLEKASKHFAPLSFCATQEKPTHCQLTLSETYSFLRDAVPILEGEGFTIYLPRWWRSDKPRLGMRLDLSESSSTSSSSALRLDSLLDYNWRIALGNEDVTESEIKTLAAAKTPLVRLRGRWVEVQPDEVNAALSFLEKQRSGQMSLLEALRHGYLADDLDTGLPFVGLRADGSLDALINATHMNQTVESLCAPEDFVGTLRPYQLRGLEWLRFLTRHGLGACLADDMGLGKTIQLIALWLSERENGQSPGPTLLVVPMSLVGNWHREIERFAPQLNVMVHHGLDRLTGQAFVKEVENYDVVISTYGLIPRDIDHLSAVSWYRIALDEAQNIKNPAAKQSTAVRSLNAVHRISLTGTPVENRLSELWSIMDFLIPGYLGSATNFRRRFAVPIERHRDGERAKRLRQLIQPFVLRRLKSDPGILKDLPEKMEMKVYCNLTREQAGLYEALVGDMLGQIEQAKGITRRGLILATLIKLKQICNHPALFLAEQSDAVHRSGKCDRLTEMLDEVVAEGDCALVFTQFKKMGEILKPILQDRLDREILFLHGGTSQRERDRLIERFQSEAGDAPVFILSLKAGGLGLNLTAANHVFHFDRWWNPAVEDQATDRAHRIGQKRQVQVHKYVCIGTLEERIDAMIERKRNLAEKIIGSGQEWITELSTNALRDLFTLSNEAVADD